MKTLTRMSVIASAIAALVISATTAHARNTEHFYSAEEAVEEDDFGVVWVAFCFGVEGDHAFIVAYLTAIVSRETPKPGRLL